jgi:hypothetical protein
MKNLRFLLITLGIVAISLAMADDLPPKGDSTSENKTEVSVSSITIDDTPFDKMMAVLTHQRCLNCHPADDRPRQGEDSHIHNFEVRRGPDNHGVAALKCESCHQNENNDFSGVPGAPEWSLAPIEMAWMGLSRVEIARSMLNPENNGGRTLEETVKHLTEHELVLWAWEPGMDAAGNPREKPPVSKEAYIKAVKEWAAGGAVIPEE